MKKKAVTVVVALLLMVIIGGAAVGKKLWDKYSYGKERADLDEYFQVSGDGECAIILQDEMIEEKAVLRDDVCYLDLETVHKYLNEAFYADMTEKLLLYTTPSDIVRVNFGENSYSTEQGPQTTDYVICYEDQDTVYVAMDFVKLYTNYSYQRFERHIQMYTQWGEKRTAEVKKNTTVRVRGGIKSPILRDVEKGETVEILEEMDPWYKVKTSDSMIGYIEIKRLTNETVVQEEPVTDYVEPEYTGVSLEGKVSLAWHPIYSVGGNDSLEGVLAETKGLNVIAPTWYSLTDAEGNFRSYASDSYVQRAHGQGLQVWGTWDDFNYGLETGNPVDVYALLSSTTIRQRLAENIAQTAAAQGLDGVNIDFEKIREDSGPHFIQFLRELSIQCHKNGLVLSVDNPVPISSNDHYRLDIQGLVADYVIIMGYDEHGAGSKEAGSVASIEYVTFGITRTLEDVPAQKVVNGLPFYTRVWKIEGANVTSSSLTIKYTADYLQKTNIQPVWDEVTAQNYAEWTSGSATYRVWLEDADSLAAKLNVMLSHEIGGVAVWDINGGSPEAWELVSAYANSQ